MRVLKIKDDIDLKELEKFGFVYFKSDDTYNFWEDYYDIGYNIEVNSKTREMIFTAHSDENCRKAELDICIIYDLIQAGLVEKVGK